MRSSIRQVSENGIGGSSLRCTLTCRQSSRSNLSGIYPVCTSDSRKHPLTRIPSLRSESDLPARGERWSKRRARCHAALPRRTCRRGAGLARWPLSPYSHNSHSQARGRDRRAAGLPRGGRSCAGAATSPTGARVTQHNGATRLGPALLFASFRGWTPAQAGGDVLAGLTLAAITIPEQMATAKLGGFEPQIGFYAFIGATIGFAAFGASRVLTAGADSTITPIFAGTLAALAAGAAGAAGAGGGPGAAAALQAAAVALALLVGGLLLVAGLLRLGWIAHLLSTPVITGFLAGVAVHIVVSQLPSLFGIAKGAGDLSAQVGAIAGGLAAANPFSNAIGLGVLAIILVTERVCARIPGALVGIVAATLAVLAFDLEGRGVAVLGALPGGLPHPTVPALNDLRALLKLALSLAIMGIVTAGV